MEPRGLEIIHLSRYQELVHLRDGAAPDARAGLVRVCGRAVVRQLMRRARAGVHGGAAGGARGHASKKSIGMQS